MILLKSYKFITFDNYYDVNTYNQFISSAIQNKIDFRQFVTVQPPYNWFLMLKDEDLPKFLVYDFATSSEMKYLLSVIRPTRPDEGYQIERRQGQGTQYWNYVTPKPFKNLSSKKYLVVFYTKDNHMLRDISKNLGKTGSKIKIYQLPRKTEQKGYFINVCFNPYIKSFISKTNILLEYSDEDKSIQDVPKQWSQVEFDINYFKLVQDKILDKTYNLPYYENGVYYPLKQTTFLI